MSFSQSVKEEILKNIKKVKGCCATSFLTAMLKSIGSLCLDSNGYSFSVESDNLDLLELASTFSQNFFDVESEIVSYQLKTKSAAAKNVKYVCKFGSKLGYKLGLIVNDGDFVQISPNVKVDLSQECCRRIFLQALFLCCGSVTIPESTGDAFAESSHSNYHLELRFSNDDFAQYVKESFAEIDFRVISRKNSTVLYLKDSAKISDFFVSVDAINARFKMENIIIGRSFRNDANRQRNCIDSNIDKSIEAGLKQLEAIKKIRENGLFDTLPQQLQEVALFREENPDANLNEFAAKFGISKSGINHRLSKLLEIAKDLK